LGSILKKYRSSPISRLLFTSYALISTKKDWATHWTIVSQSHLVTLPFAHSRLQIQRDPDTGNSKGFAFINFASFEASDAAIEAMNGQYLCNRAISVSYAFKKDAKGERHGSAAERLLAAQNPLSQADKPHQLFADAPPVPTPAMPGMPLPPPPPPGMIPPPGLQPPGLPPPPPPVALPPHSMGMMQPMPPPPRPPMPPGQYPPMPPGPPPRPGADF
jgi:splicing factor 3B subunit 4